MYLRKNYLHLTFLSSGSRVPRVSRFFFTSNQTMGPPPPASTLPVGPTREPTPTFRQRWNVGTPGVDSYAPITPYKWTLLREPQVHRTPLPNWGPSQGPVGGFGTNNLSHLGPGTVPFGPVDPDMTLREGEENVYSTRSTEVGCPSDVTRPYGTPWVTHQCRTSRVRRTGTSVGEVRRIKNLLSLPPGFCL